MNVASIVVTEQDWLNFEKQFHISRSDVKEIQNHYRCRQRLFEKKCKLVGVSEEYALSLSHTWHLLKTIDEL